MPFSEQDQSHNQIGFTISHSTQKRHTKNRTLAPHLLSSITPTTQKPAEVEIAEQKISTQFRVALVGIYWLGKEPKDKWKSTQSPGDKKRELKNDEREEWDEEASKWCAVICFLKTEGKWSQSLFAQSEIRSAKTKKNARRGMRVTDGKKREWGPKEQKFRFSLARDLVVCLFDCCLFFSYRPKLLFVALERLERLERLELLSVEVRWCWWWCCGTLK